LRKNYILDTLVECIFKQDRHSARNTFVCLRYIVQGSVATRFTSSAITL